MSGKITPDHLGRAAVVYVRQSTMAQVMGNLESQRRQYVLAGAAVGAGFASVRVIDDDLLHRGLAPGAQRARLASPRRPLRVGGSLGDRSGRRL